MLNAQSLLKNQKLTFNPACACAAEEAEAPEQPPAAAAAVEEAEAPEESSVAAAAAAVNGFFGTRRSRSTPTAYGRDGVTQD